MSIKTYKTAVCASALMAVVAWSGGAFAISQNFETDATGITIGTAGTVGSATTTEPACGYPIAGAHTKVLAITGTVTYAESATPSSNASQVDLMFKAEPTDELDDLADQTDVKVALAVVTNGVSDSTVSVKLWCKAKNAEEAASWVDLCNVPNASWARATLVLDYTSGRCRVSINGDPQVTASAVEDAWYTFANTTSDTYLQSVTMVGSTEVDDFVVSHYALAGYTEPFNGEVNVASTGKTITYDDLNKYGITVAQAAADADVSDGAGMKISEKIEAGLNPKSATKFELQTMSTDVGSVTVTFPGNKGTGNYTLKVGTSKGGSDVATQTSSQTSASGECMNSATASIPAADQDKLLYFTVETN